MSDFSVRVLDEVEHRAANTVSRLALHDPPATDEQWHEARHAYLPGRTFGAFAGDRLVGTAMSYRSSMTLPGGGSLPAAAVARVGVAPDHRRRGVLTELMRAQLTELAAAGEPLAALHASEPVIYGRFGYGIGTVARTVRVKARDAALRAGVPCAGEVRLVPAREALDVLPEVYQRAVAARPGMLGRDTDLWSMGYRRPGTYRLIAVHTGPDGGDGFVTYETQEEGEDDPRGGATLRVLDFHAANQVAANALWRYLIGVDLVSEVVVYSRPLDDPLEAMLVNQHAVRSELDDELWVRLVDVPAALAGREYRGTESLVVEVRDRFLPANSGRYRIGSAAAGGVARTDEPAGLAVDVDVLAMLYLGSWRASALAGVGRLDVLDPAAPALADRLFATDVAACCGTLF